MSNYIPYLSSSPPPLEAQESPDNEDFGNFASANFAYNSEGVLDSPIKCVAASQKKICSEHVTPENSSSPPFTPNHVGNSVDDRNWEDDNDEHNSSFVLPNETAASPSSKSSVREKSKVENCDSKDTDNDVGDDRSGTNASFVEAKASNDWETDCCDTGSSCADDWADFAAASPSFVGDNSSSRLQQENDIPPAWNSDPAVDTHHHHRKCSQDEETLQTKAITSSTHREDEFTDFTVCNDSSVTEEATLRTDFEPDSSRETVLANVTTNGELADPSVSFVDDKSAEQDSADDVLRGGVIVAEGGGSDDEFADFVRPTDDCSVLVDEQPVLPIADWSSAAVAGSIASDDNDDLSKNNSRRGSEETFQPPFEASFDDEFSTFTSAPICFAPQGISDANKLESIICTNFSEHSISALDKCDVEPLDLISDNSKCFQTNLWPNLCDFEKTNALTYHWSNSNSSKKLLKALNIDSRNLLFGHNWNSSIPIFAANLSFNPLEPIKTPWKPEERGDLSVTEPANQIVKSEEVREVIPPAQFDWNSSGLTNPLDGLENELLGPAADNEDNRTSPSCSKAFPLLEQILSNAKFSAGNLSASKEKVVLSDEAKMIISQLPDLNFMQAKVLMFPIREVLP